LTKPDEPGPHHPTFLNFPSLLQSYNNVIKGDLNLLLVVFQAIVAVASVETCRTTKMIEAYPPLSFKTVVAWAPVNLFFCFMLFTSMGALQYNSVPLVTVFKNVTNIFTTAGDYVFFGNVAERLVIAAFVVMLVGAVAAAGNDVYVTPTGLLWMAANCISTSGYVLYMKFATQHVKLNTFGMVYVNNVLCVLFLLPAAYWMGQIQLLQDTQAIHTFDYFSKNVFAGWVGFFLNLASLHCVAATGPTTYAIVGSLNKIPLLLMGYLLFDDVITSKTWCFIGVSMCGGFLYSYAKIDSAKRKAASREDAK
jgi:GDP-mannose transporter